MLLKDFQFTGSFFEIKAFFKDNNLIIYDNILREGMKMNRSLPRRVPIWISSELQMYLKTITFVKNAAHRRHTGTSTAERPPCATDSQERRVLRKCPKRPESKMKTFTKPCHSNKFRIYKHHNCEILTVFWAQETSEWNYNTAFRF